ncbi:MAG TPA: hypothetical protein PLL92_06000 [Alicycliphilus sp.]|nr:hypothetical protein [Alicycliphilus sp.]
MKKVFSSAKQWAGQGLKWGSDAAREVAKQGQLHRSQMADLGAQATRRAGRAMQIAGDTLIHTAGATAQDLRAAGAGSASPVTKAAARAGAALVDATGVAAKAVAWTGEKTQTTAPAVGQAAAGMVCGVASTAANALDAVAIRDTDLDLLQQRLRLAGYKLQSDARWRGAAIANAVRRRSKARLLDLLAVGGVSLGSMVAGTASVPPEVEQAFALAYPGLAASGMDFLDAVQSKSSGELLGLVNGVKGKLFEMDLMAHLNAGGLPAGLMASLAPSATQPGYDLLVTDANGTVVDLLQAKATDSVSYVQAALERYPDIDVMTTTEVHARLLALGMGDRVADSGISEAALQQKIEAASGMADAAGTVDWLPGGASVALIALSALVDRSVSLEQRSAQAGERVAAVGVTGVAGKAALMATGYWWLGLAAGLGSKFLADHGGAKRERLEALRRAVEAAERQAASGKRLRLRPQPGQEQASCLISRRVRDFQRHRNLPAV